MWRSVGCADDGLGAPTALSANALAILDEVDLGYFVDCVVYLVGQAVKMIIWGWFDVLSLSAAASNYQRTILH